MPNLPTTRQRQHSKASASRKQVDPKESLTRAFLTFTQAAGSLERSYSQLQSEVRRLHLELEQANAELERSVEENQRMRGYLSRVLDNLPCGVVVVDERGEAQVVNPEAKKLLQLEEAFGAAGGAAIPDAAEEVLRHAPTNGTSWEHEVMQAQGGKRSIAIVRASTIGESGSDRIWILRDVTEEKKLAAEREAARRSVALAEIATVLAHEIRNPLGSLELFTGLLADATAHMPETRQWMTHLQAGLRALSATMTNVVDVYINYLRRKVDAGHDRTLIRTIRGTGYQIGTNVGANGSLTGSAIVTASASAGGVAH